MSFSVEKALGKKAIIEVSYVGERGRHLANSYDQNQPGYGATTNTAITNGFSYSQIQRPYFSQYPNFAKITDTSSFGSSDANAFQAYIRTRGWHGLISEISYALSTSKGTGTIEDYNNPRSTTAPTQSSPTKSRAIGTTTFPTSSAVRHGWPASGSRVVGRLPARSISTALLPSRRAVRVLVTVSLQPA